jgi:type I restriction enzyme, R subunit
MNEADTCAEYVLPAITAAGWAAAQVKTELQVLGERHPELNASAVTAKRRADYVLEMRPGVPLIVVEAKRLWSSPGDGLQQAIRYATLLDAPFALSTNGTGWVLHNMVSGSQMAVTGIPTPTEAWDLFCESHALNDEAKDLLLAPFDRTHRGADGSVRELRYYQRRAIHEVLSSLSRGERRVLLVMATGTGKTFTAMQLVWKLWNYRREQQRHDNALPNYRMLYLSDRDVLVKDPLNKTFVQAFPDQSAMRVSRVNRRHSPDLYFATYQAFDAEYPGSEPADESSALLDYPADFFDLVVVDECHRGSARDNSTWRGILDHFAPAAQLGLTATPVNKGAADTFDYFGNPVFQYSLREGIEDGFLAPYTIRRVILNPDAEGIDIAAGMVDTTGRELPGGTYTTRDFERTLSLPDRTRAMARVIDRVIGDSGDRAIVFCVDKDHALDMVRYLRELRPERTVAEPEWAVRIMSVERDKVRLLEEFTDPERTIPQIAVSSRLLSTGVDIQDLRYVIIARPVGSVPEFKQIIGRGTRLYPDKGKYEFEIMDFVGATTKFSDPSFDGPPLKDPVTEPVDGNGDPLSPVGGVDGNVDGEPEPPQVNEPEPLFIAGGSSTGVIDGGIRAADKFVLDGIKIDIVSEGFWVHDVESGQPRLVSYTDWAKERVLSAFDGPEDLLHTWSDADGRTRAVAALRGAHIDSERLTQEMGLSLDSGIDLVDQLLHLAWNLPVATRAERARSARERHNSELRALSDRARTVLELLLDIYATNGIDEVASDSIAQVPPLRDKGTPAQIAGLFGGPSQWHEARTELQHWLYSA